MPLSLIYSIVLAIGAFGVFIFGGSLIINLWGDIEGVGDSKNSALTIARHIIYKRWKRSALFIVSLILILSFLGPTRASFPRNEVTSQSVRERQLKELDNKEVTFREIQPTPTFETKDIEAERQRLRSDFGLE